VLYQPLVNRSAAVGDSKIIWAPVKLGQKLMSASLNQWNFYQVAIHFWSAKIV